jgi:NAD(P)H-dependent FMN reductase
MKNALDWLSGAHHQSSLKGKPTITFTVIPAFTGETRAQQQLNEALWAMQTILLSHPQIVIADVDAKIRDGRLWGEAAKQFWSRVYSRSWICAGSAAALNIHTHLSMKWMKKSPNW